MKSLIKDAPELRVRKILGQWVVQRFVYFSGMGVWKYITDFPDWRTAYDVADVIAREGVNA